MSTSALPQAPTAVVHVRRHRPVIYLFADKPQPAWMLWWGLGITILSVILALWATKIGAKTMFSRRDPEGDVDQTVDDSDSFAGRLRGEEPPNPYGGFLPPDSRN